MQDAVGNRVTLVGRDGAALRVSLPFAPSSQLAIAALDALRCVLPEVWWKLYAQWLATPGGPAAPPPELHRLGWGLSEQPVVPRTSHRVANSVQEAQPAMATGSGRL